MIGIGYVDLVSGACVSEFGKEVACVDEDVAKIEGLKAGRIPIFEPALETLVRANMKAGRLGAKGDCPYGLSICLTFSSQPESFLH